MQKVMIENSSTGSILANEGGLADNYLSRLKGLIGKKDMAEGEGLIINPCMMVHSIGMKINIDVLFISKNNEIVHIVENMTPNRISPYIKAAQYVIELPAGQVLRTGTTVGDKINITSG